MLLFSRNSQPQHKSTEPVPTSLHHAGWYQSSSDNGFRQPSPQRAKFYGSIVYFIYAFPKAVESFI
jgi:hypothetical protein